MSRINLGTVSWLAAALVLTIGCNRDKDDGGDGLGEGGGDYEGLDAGDPDEDMDTGDTGFGDDAVSYTHLTLPTILRV